MAVDKKAKAVSAPVAVVAKKKIAPAAPPKPAPAPLLARKKAENDGAVQTRGVGKRVMIYAAAALLGKPRFVIFGMFCTTFIFCVARVALDNLWLQVPSHCFCSRWATRTGACDLYILLLPHAPCASSHAPSNDFHRSLRGASRVLRVADGGRPFLSDRMRGRPAHKPHAS